MNKNAITKKYRKKIQEDARRWIALLGIKDKMIVNRLVNQFEYMGAMCYYDGMRAGIDVLDKALNPEPKKRGK